MRSSKSRSRSKSNRSRSVGNIVNRVFDSSGPEGKVRGTPQQIIDKYTQLARDAQLSNDRVATENFQQHAEHYIRMLGEAQREADARRDQEQQSQQRDRPRDQQDDRQQGGNGHGGQESRIGHAGEDDRQQGGDGEPQAGNNGGNNGGRGGERPQPGSDGQYARDDGRQARDDVQGTRSDGQPGGDERHAASAMPAETRRDTQPSDVVDLGDAPDGGLVETPEQAAPKPAPKPRKPRSRKPKPAEATGQDGGDAAAEGGDAGADGSGESGSKAAAE